MRGLIALAAGGLLAASTANAETVCRSTDSDHEVVWDGTTFTVPGKHCSTDVEPSEYTDLRTYFIIRCPGEQALSFFYHQGDFYLYEIETEAEHLMICPD